MAGLRSIVHLFVVCTFAVVGVLSVAANGHAEMSSIRVASGLSFPVYVTAPRGDPRLFIVERAGKIKILKNFAVLPTPFLDISPLPMPGERGLLGLAFAPDYAVSGFFYIYYTNAAGDSVVERYKCSAADSNGVYRRGIRRRVGGRVRRDGPEAIRRGAERLLSVLEDLETLQKVLKRLQVRDPSFLRNAALRAAA